MPEEAPGIVTIGDARDIQRLWELGHDPNHIAEALGLTYYEVLYVLGEAKRLDHDAFHRFDPVKEVTDIHIAHMWEDDHLPCVALFFKDEKGRTRFAEILYNEIGPGMARYAPHCQKAYDDLVEAINNYYQMKRETDQGGEQSGRKREEG